MTQRTLSLITPNISHSGPLKKRGKVSSSKTLPLWRYGRWNIFLEFDSELFWNIKGYRSIATTLEPGLQRDRKIKKMLLFFAWCCFSFTRLATTFFFLLIGGSGSRFTRPYFGMYTVMIDVIIEFWGKSTLLRSMMILFFLK